MGAGRGTNGSGIADDYRLSRLGPQRSGQVRLAREGEILRGNTSLGCPLYSKAMGRGFEGLASFRGGLGEKWREG